VARRRPRIDKVREALVLLAVAAGICEGQTVRGGRARPCDPPTPLGPSHDLYCIELVAAPGFNGVSGRVELASPPGPFTVAVTAAGHSRFIPIFHLSGLPSSGTYIAWATTPQMDSLIELGEVKNGRVTLRPIDFDKFNILISAERSTRVREPRGRIIVRGQSPSTRPFPPDLLEFSLGAARSGDAMGHGEHESAGWPMVPTPSGVTMLPSEMALRPEVTPFLPVADSPIPNAESNEVLRLKDGDVIDLDAELVRRTINGQTYTMYSYNGQYPGPLIEVARGSEIMVRFTNHLADSTSIHWHGIRLENAFDGVDGVGVGDAFTYKLRFPDAGIYWYHPHIREDIQQALGLYGNILVRQPGAKIPANREQILMLQDLLVGDAGLIPWGQESPTHALMGRFGNVFLVNGEPGYRLSVRRGEVVRFYFTNASSTRTLNLSFPGARMKLVASDAGPFEREAWVESVVIAPAERYVVHVRFDKPGKVALVNKVIGLDHLFGRFFPQVDTLGVVSVAREPVRDDLRASFVALRRDTATFAALEPYRRFLDKAPDQTLVLTLQTHGLPFVTERLMQLDSIYFAPVEWGGTMPMMNWASTGRQVRWVLKDPATGQENMDIAWHFRRGEPAKIRLVNQRRAFHGMQHPIHLHGQRFLVLAVNGVPNKDLAWKDTVLVPAGAVVDILLDTANPGEWMLHCHIAEHLSAGMMMHFTID
jgi:suppressor of ftsI